jgi:hypothetical protein
MATCGVGGVLMRLMGHMGLGFGNLLERDGGSLVGCFGSLFFRYIRFEGNGSKFSF